MEEFSANRSKFFSYISFRAVYMAMNVWHDLDVSGSIPKEGPTVVMAKHQAYRDIPLECTAIFGTTRRYCHWIMRENLPSFTKWGGGIPVYRLQDMEKMDEEDKKKAGEFNKKAYGHIEDLLVQGEVIVVHPEATRKDGLGNMNPIDERITSPFKMIERRHNIDIAYVPLGINYEALNFRAHVDMKFGTPLYQKDHKKDLSSRIAEDICSLSGIIKDPVSVIEERQIKVYSASTRS